LILVLAVHVSFNWRAFMQATSEGHGVKAFQEGRHADAEGHFRTATDYAASLRADDPCRGRLLERCTELARAQGKYDDAEKLAQQWIKAEEAAWGDADPHTLRAVESLATMYDDIARHAQALPLLEQALRGRESRRQFEAYEYALCLTRMAEHWCRLERYERAEAPIRQACEILRRSNADATIEGLAAASMMALVCVHVDKLDEADLLAQSALALAKKNPAPASMPVAYCLQRLAYVRRYQDRFAEAEELLRQAISIVQRAAPNNPFALHGDWHLLGVILKEQGRWAEAEECYRDTLRLRDEFLAPEDLSIARAEENYAELLELMGRNDEAHVHANRAASIREFHSPFRIV
jgi:tetratricopeptide (TPR) repeat protein